MTTKTTPTMSKEAAPLESGHLNLVTQGYAPSATEDPSHPSNKHVTNLSTQATKGTPHPWNKGAVLSHFDEEVGNRIHKAATEFALDRDKTVAAVRDLVNNIPEYAKQQFKQALDVLNAASSMKDVHLPAIQGMVFDFRNGEDFTHINRVDFPKIYRVFTHKEARSTLIKFLEDVKQLIVDKGLEAFKTALLENKAEAEKSPVMVSLRNFLNAYNSAQEAPVDHISSEIKKASINRVVLAHLKHTEN